MSTDDNDGCTSSQQLTVNLLMIPVRRTRCAARAQPRVHMNFGGELKPISLNFSAHSLFLPPCLLLRLFSIDSAVFAGFATRLILDSCTTVEQSQKPTASPDNASFAAGMSASYCDKYARLFVCLSVCCVTFAESEPYCHSILFVCLDVCRSFRDLQPTTIDRSQPNLVGRYIIYLSSDPCKPFWIPYLPYFRCQREKYAKFGLFPKRT